MLPWNWVMPGKVIAMETLIGAALAADVDLNVSAFCAARGLSRQTFYKYRGRFKAEGVAGLTQRSRAPKTTPGRIPIEVEELIVGLRKELEEIGTEHGPATVLFHLGRRYRGEFTMPSEATIWRILDRRRVPHQDAAETTKVVVATLRGLGAERVVAGRLHEMGDRHRARASRDLVVRG